MSNIEFIEDNPFYASVDGNEAAIWAYENERRVKTKIKYTLKKMGHALRDDVEEVYDELICYFIKSGNEFNKDYFLEELTEEIGKDILDIDYEGGEDKLESFEEMIEQEENSGYELSTFVLNRAYYTAMGYVRELNRKKEMIRFRDYSEEGGTVSLAKTMLEDRVYFLADNEEEGIFDKPDIICEHEELQEILEKDLCGYDKELGGSLKGFDTRKFVESALLMELDDEKDKARAMGVEIVVYQNYISGFRAITKNKTERGQEYYDLRNSITELVRGKNRGWVPKLICSI